MQPVVKSLVQLNWNSNFNFQSTIFMRHVDHQLGYGSGANEGNARTIVKHLT
jgi:hypothetical protein